MTVYMIVTILITIIGMQIKNQIGGWSRIDG